MFAIRNLPKISANPIKLSTRSLKTLKFADTTETVYERADFPKEKLAKIFKNDTLAVIGYGTQGMAQSLNARDNGLNVIVGLRKGKTFNKGVI